MRRLPCVDGLQHQWVDGFCSRCGTDWWDRQWYCGLLCEDNEYGVYERPIAVAPAFREWKDGAQITETVVRSSGTCEDCLEIHRRNDQRAARRARLTVQTWAQYVASDRRKAASEAMWKEREERWQHEQAQRTERQRQRRLLREGQATMTAIRRVLRGQDRLQPLASTQEKSSPI